MARPIKETPILQGKNAEIFLTNIKNSYSLKVSSSEANRISQNYEQIKNLSQKKDASGK